MKNWIISINGVITLSVIAMLIFLARTFFDFYYVYPEFNLGLSVATFAIFINSVVFGGWIWSLMSAAKNNRRGLIAIFAFELFFLVIIALGTLIYFCPTPCGTAWPMGELLIWVSLVFGGLAALSTGVFLRQNV